MPKKQGSNYKPTKQEQLNAWKHSNNAYSATIAQLENMKNGWGDYSNVTPSSFGSRKSAPLVDKEGFASRYQTDTIPKLEQQEIDMGIGQDAIQSLGDMKYSQMNAERQAKKQREQQQIDYASSMSDNDKISLWLTDGYKLSKEEKKQAKKMIKSYEATAKNPNVYDLTPEEKEEMDRYMALKDKTSASEAFLYGAMKAVPGVDFLMRKGDDGSDYGYSDSVDAIKTQNPLAYYGGQFGTMAAETAGMQGILGATKYGSAVKKAADKVLGDNVASKIVADTLTDAPVDIATDTIPQLLENINEGASASETAKDLGLNVLLNTAINSGVATLSNLGEIKQAVGNVVDSARKKSIANELNPLEMAAKNADGIDDLARQSDDAVTRLEKARNDAKEKVLNGNIPTDTAEVELLTNNDLSQNHTHEEIKTMSEYLDSSDKDVVDFVRKVRDDGYKTKDSIRLLDTDEKMARDIKDTLGYDTSGYEISLESNGVEHIDTDHGVNGVADNSMADENTLGRIRYVLQNYDGFEKGLGTNMYKHPLKNGKNGKSDTIVFYKKVDGKYYIVEAVPDTKSKKNYIVSAYTDASSIKKGDKHLTDVQAPAVTSKTKSVYSPESKVPFNETSVNHAEAQADNFLQSIHAEKESQSAIPFVETVDDVPKADNAIPSLRNMDDVPKAESTPGVFDTTNGTPGAMRERSYDNRTIVNKTDMPDEIKQEFIDEPDLYRVISNEETSSVADEIMASNDFDGAYSKFNDLLDARDPASIPLGYDLARQAAENKNYDLSVDILERMSEKLTKAGQFTQAAAIRMMGSDPMAAQRLMQREIAKINKSGVDKFGRSWKKIALNEAELEAFKNINKGDTEAIENLFDSVTKRVSKEIPATKWEKLVEATKTSMMLNPRTHIRNIASNTIMVPVRSISDRVSALGQNAVHLFDKDFEVTQSLVGGTKEQKKIAGQIFDTRIKPLLEGNNEYKEVAKNATRGKQVFNDSMVGKGLQKATLSATSFANNITGGRLQKLVDTLDESLTGSVMENLRKFDYYLLGAVEDDPFVKSNFKNRLASYMKAQGINAIDDVPDEAVQIAYQEALKATFKDDNYLTKMFSGIKGNLGKFGEVLFPFTKTPANLAKRGIEYSPAGFVESLIQLKKEGKLTTEIVDNLSKNAVGTAGIFIGYELAKNGMINGSLSDNKREKQFQKQQGKQAYSINIDGQSYTFDWAQPAAIPLIIGATIYDAIKVSDDEAFEALSTFDKAKKYASIAKDSAVAAFDSWADLTPLQSFKEIFGGNGYGDGSTGENIISAVTEFPLRLIPAAAGSTARTVDKTYRETYVKDDPVETLANQAKAKIPALGDDNNWWNQNVSSKSLPASYDGWGRERTRQDTTSQAAFANFINPGSMSNAKQTEIDPEILRLFEATGDENVFPGTAEYSVKDADKKDVTLNNEQHSELQRELGVTSYDLVSNFIKTDAYNTLDDTAKKDAITGLYKAANQYVKNKLYGTEASDKIAKMLINGATPEEVSKYVKMSADFNKYGLTMTEKNIAAYERAMRTGNAEETVNRTLQKESERREVYKANNVNSGKEVDAVFEKAYASGGAEAATQALKQYKQEKQMFQKYGMEDSATAKEVYEKTQSEDMLQKYSRLSKLGKQKDQIDMLYSDDFESIPTLDKGYLLAQTISGNKVTKPMKEAGNYEAFYRYYDVKRAADVNDNNTLSKKEKSIAVTYLMKQYGYSKQEAQIIAKEWYK